MNPGVKEIKTRSISASLITRMPMPQKKAGRANTSTRSALTRSKDILSNPKEHRGIIYIDFSEMPLECQNYSDYISRIQDGLIRDLKEAYSALEIEEQGAIWDILSMIFNRTGHKFMSMWEQRHSCQKSGRRQKINGHQPRKVMQKSSTEECCQRIISRFRMKKPSICDMLFSGQQI